MGIPVRAGRGAQRHGRTVNRDVVLGEWRRVARTLSAAELLVREDYPEDAVARAYETQSCTLPEAGTRGTRYLR